MDIVSNTTDRPATISIDVVMPSIRHNNEILLSIMDAIHVPSSVVLHWYIVSDNPAVKPGDFNHNGFPIHVIAGKNIGAPMARNVGIEAGQGDYILFLDDDITPAPDILTKYVDAIKTSPNVAGYIGPTLFPDPINPFTRGLYTSDILTFFDLSAKGEQFMMWGTTSNLLIPRQNVGKHTRFSSTFPKHGGGEDIDFCIRVGKNNTTGVRAFKTVPDAYVKHGWWNNGHRSYRRFFRWGFGDVSLSNYHPEHNYYGPPNMPEMLFIGVPIFVCLEYLGVFGMVGTATSIYVGSVIASEFVGEWLRTNVTHPGSSIRDVIEATLTRISNDVGKFVGRLRHDRFLYTFTRFDYFGDGMPIKFERKIASYKLVLPTILMIATYVIAQL